MLDLMSLGLYIWFNVSFDSKWPSLAVNDYLLEICVVPWLVMGTSLRCFVCIVDGFLVLDVRWILLFL
jgi:hypothetical protein